MFGLDGLELDGDLFARDDIDSEVDITCYFKKGSGRCDALASSLMSQERDTYRKNRSQFFCRACTFLQHGGRAYGKKCLSFSGVRVPKVASGGVGVSNGSKEKWRKESKRGRS